MEHMNIAIVSDDQPYAQALAEALLIGNRSFDLSIYDCEKFCLRWEREGIRFRKAFDLVLWDGEDLTGIYGGNLVWLSDRKSLADRRLPADQKAPAAGAQGDEPGFIIYKYSPSQALVAAVFNIYEQLTGRRPPAVRPDREDVFAVASWQGGSGCTTLSMALAQEFARFYGRKVLYLSLEGVESADQFMPDPQGMKNAGEYLYHLMKDRRDSRGEDSPEQMPFLEEYLIRDSWGVSAFSPSGGCNPLSTARPEELRGLLGALMCSGFEVIIIDAGCGTGEQVREALACADRILLVSGREQPEREARYRAFLRSCSGYGQADAVEGCSEESRLIRVCNQQTGTGQESPRQIHIARRQGLSPDLLLEGQFGKDIHRLAELCYN